MAEGCDLPLIRFTLSHTIFIRVYEFSFNIYDLQLSLFDSLTTIKAFTLTILIDSRFDCDGFLKKFFKAALQFLIMDLQSSLNHGFCRIFNLPQVFGIVFKPY
jgi:hypothetical protein